MLGTPNTHSPSVVKAIKDANAKSQRYILIVGGSDTALHGWVKLMADLNYPVLVASSDILPFGDPIPKTRTVELPATFDDIIAAIGAPPYGGALGSTVVGADGNVQVPISSHDDEVEENNPVDPFAGLFSGPDGDSNEAGPTVDQTSPPSHTAVAAPQVPQEEAGSQPIFAPAPIYAPDDGSQPPPAPAPIFPPPATDAPPPIMPPQPQPLLQPQPQHPPVVTGAPPPPLSAQPIAPSSSAPPPPPPVNGTPLAPTYAYPADATPSHPSGDTSVFRDVPVTQSTGLGSGTKPLAPTIVVIAGKGGVGKSVISAALAERAATVGGLKRVVLVDANRGQGDARNYLRVSGQLPSVLDAAVSGDAVLAIVGPTRLNSSRPQGSQTLSFGVVLAPTPDQADPTVITAGVYRDVITRARQTSDLVVIDTQISEGWDNSGLIDGVMIPLIIGGAWGLVISDSSRPGWLHMQERLRHLQQQGVPATRMMAALNRVAPDSAMNPQAVAQLVTPYATWVGSSVANPVVDTTINTGRIPGTPGTLPTPEFTALLDAVLSRVTGLGAFSPSVLQSTQSGRRGRRASRKNDRQSKRQSKRNGAQ